MLSPQEQRQLLRLEQQLSMPTRKFIISNGLAWGICMLVLIFLIEWFINGRPPARQWEEGYWLNFLFMPLGGLLYGWMVRRMLERRYRKLKEKQEMD